MLVISTKNIFIYYEKTTYYTKIFNYKNVYPAIKDRVKLYKIGII